ncbi:hypothetical protein HPB48_022021 [Haemaphysalis longicornis]|uniref:ATP-dependent DNA helicase n=1 Tax=Haemaphysalis longicornis TaxID=44386 RepID=A0A9J6G1A1_HAELO|nr:hypothetical protein HPB48_022021 [Haemaphysalis longicornis]
MRKRQDIMGREEYYNSMWMTNAEQNELLREIIHRQTTASAPPLRVFFTGPAGCDKTFVLPLAMDLFNRYSNTGNNTAYNAFFICASTGKAAVAVGGTTVHVAFKLCRKITGPNQDRGLSASELNTFRVAFRNVKYVIIDEVSRMSADNLNAVDLSRPHGCFAYYSGLPHGKMVKFLCFLFLSVCILVKQKTQAAQF